MNVSFIALSLYILHSEPLLTHRLIAAVGKHCAGVACGQGEQKPNREFEPHSRLGEIDSVPFCLVCFLKKIPMSLDEAILLHNAVLACCGLSR